MIVQDVLKSLLVCVYEKKHANGKPPSVVWIILKAKPPSEGRVGRIIFKAKPLSMG
jgi:hypothetical protein